ncbi:hypothetical protein BDV18DRAFT_10059 [Aspergillus unguis]
MAGTATATYPADAWTSASTIDANQQQWDYSVPVGQENRRRSKSRSHKSRDRGSKGSRSSSLSKNAYSHERHTSRGRRDPSLNRRESDNGSVRDTTGMNGSIRKSEIKEGDENWIHRDKLARIESEELQQAAFLFQRRPGTGSTKTGRGRSRDQNHSSIGGNAPATSPPTESTEPWPELQEDRHDNAVPTTLPDVGNLTDEERQNWDLRRPEEIAADIESGAARIYGNPGLRKSSSRIPIPMSSPAPLSPEQIDREYFTPRSRAPTNEEEELPTFGTRRRASEPFAVESDSPNESNSESRPGSRGVQLSQTAAGKKTAAKTGATNRKTSAPLPKKTTTTPRSRATSSGRPITRSGETRPTTAVNRPEGDPPWLATMYKPDPRLPPDQQILPTHARKMQQEQWAKEGKTPTTYDREFAPLAIAPDPPSLESKTEKEGGKEAEKEEEEKPQHLKTEGLGLQPLSKSPEPGSRPGTSTGYSPMPKVQDTPPTGLAPRFNSQTVVTAQGPPTEDEKVGKGCGCCIVM